MKVVLSLFWFTFLLSASPAKAQDFEGHAREIIDSMVNLWQTDSAFASRIPDDKEYFMRLGDSLVKAFVTEHLHSLIDNDKYSWPYWYFERRSMWYNDTSIRYPTRTQQYLLARKYNVSMKGVSNGCLAQEAFVLHDSLMMDELCKCYGKDFFQRSSAEADALDKAGKGLNLPFIKNQKYTANTLKHVFERADTLSNGSTFFAQKSKPFLVIEFRGDNIAKAYWGQRSWGGIQFSSELFNPEEDLEGKLQRMGWTGPALEGRPTEAIVYFDFDTGTLQFL